MYGTDILYNINCTHQAQTGGKGAPYTFFVTRRIIYIFIFLYSWRTCRTCQLLIGEVELFTGGERFRKVSFRDCIML